MLGFQGCQLCKPWLLRILTADDVDDADERTAFHFSIHPRYPESAVKKIRAFMAVVSIIILRLGETEVFSQDAGAGERGDVDFDAVVEVGVPALGPFGGGFPRGRMR